MLVEDKSALEVLVAEARASTPKGEKVRLALDTEADSYHCYREKLCLIQFGANGRFAVIDPLKIGNDNHQPLLDLMAESEIWFHGSDYDLLLWKRTFGILPHFVYDTQIAAQLIGTEKFGLAALLEEHFDVHLAKESQRADWGKRPLSAEMVEYAINDVRHLLPLADRLLAELDRLGRREWFIESCQANLDSSANRKEKDPDELWRVRGWGRLKPRGWAYLRAIWQWRDMQAAAVDRPAFKVMPNGKLIYLAERLQTGKESRLVGKYTEAQKAAFNTMVDEARALPDNELPKRRRGTGRGRIPDLPERVEPIKLFRDVQAKELGLDPALIASRTVLEDLVINPADAEDTLMRWQYQIMAPAIEQLKLPPTG